MARSGPPGQKPSGNPVAGMRSRRTNATVGFPDHVRVRGQLEAGGCESHAQDLFIKPNSDSGAEQPLVTTPYTKALTDGSSDGRTLLYTTLDPTTGADVWALPMTGDRKPFPVLRTAFEEQDAHFSPDGRWMAYQSNESGKSEVYVRPFPGPGGSQLVSTSGGTQPRWGRDGKELFYVTPDSHLVSIPVTVAADGHTIAGAPVQLFAVRLASGSFVMTAGGAMRGQYVVAPDGRFLMNVAVDEAATPPISVVFNWDKLVGNK